MFYGEGKSAGIGAKLCTTGIGTVQDLKEASPSAMRAHFGVVLERTCRELRSLSCLELEEVTPPRKEIVSAPLSIDQLKDIRERSDSPTCVPCCGRSGAFVKWRRPLTSLIATLDRVLACLALSERHFERSCTVVHT